MRQLAHIYNHSRCFSIHVWDKACWDIFLCAIKYDHINLFGLPVSCLIWFRGFFFFVLLWHPNFSSFFCPSPFSLLWLIFYFIYFLSLSVSSSYFLLFPVPPFFLPSSFPQLMATNTQMVSLSLSVSHPLFSFSLICFYPSHLPPPTLTLKHISLSPKTFPFSLVHSFIRPGCCRINPPPLSCSPLIV